MIGTAFEKARKKQDLSIAQLARTSGVSRPTVQKVLAGDTYTSRVDTLTAVATALGLELNVTARRPRS